MKRFFDTSPNRNQNVYEYNDNLFKRGDNALAGVFVADKTNEEEKRFIPLEVHLEGNLGMFSYGLWASDRPEDNRAELSIPMNREILYPLPPVKTVVGLQVRDSIELTYKKENGFRGAYIYKDQIGTIESDVHLNATYTSSPSGRANISIKGFVAKPFTMEGDDFESITLQGLSVAANDGFVTHIKTNNNHISGSTAKFGTTLFNATTGNADSITAQQNISDHGNWSFTVGATAGQEGSVSLKNYPEHIGGEIKVTGFSLDETENYADNTIVGVFVGDRDSGRNASDSTKIE